MKVFPGESSHPLPSPQVSPTFPNTALKTSPWLLMSTPPGMSSCPRSDWWLSSNTSICVARASSAECRHGNNTSRSSRATCRKIKKAGEAGREKEGGRKKGHVDSSCYTSHNLAGMTFLTGLSHMVIRLLPYTCTGTNLPVLNHNTPCTQDRHMNGHP